MKRRERQLDDIDIYFKSDRFRGRLDRIRDLSNDPSELKVYAISIVEKLGLKLEHTDIIYRYLNTGEYSRDRQPTIRFIDRSLPNHSFTDPEADVASLDDYGVFIELSEDTTRDDIISFAINNWSDVKKSLNNNYPTRIKRFVAKNRLDNYLEIADVINAAEDPHDRARKAEDLANKHNIESREVYAIAKEYRSILQD